MSCPSDSDPAVEHAAERHEARPYPPPYLKLGRLPPAFSRSDTPHSARKADSVKKRRADFVERGQTHSARVAEMLCRRMERVRDKLAWSDQLVSSVQQRSAHVELERTSTAQSHRIKTASCHLRVLESRESRRREERQAAHDLELRTYDGMLVPKPPSRVDTGERLPGLLRPLEKLLPGEEIAERLSRKVEAHQHHVETRQSEKEAKQAARAEAKERHMHLVREKQAERRMETLRAFSRKVQLSEEASGRAQEFLFFRRNPRRAKAVRRLEARERLGAVVAQEALARAAAIVDEAKERDALLRTARPSCAEASR